MFIVKEKPKSISAESYKTLRTNIQYSSFDKEIASILVTSAEPGEGKSTTAGNLAISFAQDNKKVILIDCDLRKPVLHKRFKISNVCGLSDLLIGKEVLEDVVNEFDENLHILTSGKIPPNPSEMLGSKNMNNLLKALKSRYDIIIIDSAPLQAVTDAQILSTRTDATIIVIRAGKTKKEVIVQAKNLLEKVRANIIGIVLNGTEELKSKYYHYYGSQGRE